SMRKRNGTSYAFGLRLWEIYNRRLIESASTHERLVTHYDLFFENAEKELQRIANFVGLPGAKIHGAAELVATKRRHTHFTVDQLIDARVSGEVIDLYRSLIAEAAPAKTQASVGKSTPRPKSHEADLLPGAVSRLDVFVPDRFVQLEHLYGELLAQAEARHVAETERHKGQVKELTTHLAKTEKQYISQIEEISAHLAKTEKQYISQIEEISAHLAKTERDYNNQIEELRQRIAEMNDLLHQRSVNLAEDEKYIGELTDRLRKQLYNTRRLSRLLNDTDAAAR